MLGGVDGLVNDLKNVGADKIPLAQHPNAGAVPLQEVVMLDELFQLGLCELHQSFDLVFRPVVVFDAEGIDRDNFHAALVTNFQDLTNVRRFARDIKDRQKA